MVRPVILQIADVNLYSEIFSSIKQFFWFIANIGLNTRFNNSALEFWVMTFVFDMNTLFKSS